MKDNRGKKTFTSWSKKNMISYQKVGEIENKSMTERAKKLFTNRRQKYTEPVKANNDRFTKNARGRKGTKTELKRPDQILKVFCYYEQYIICF